MPRRTGTIRPFGERDGHAEVYRAVAGDFLAVERGVQAGMTQEGEATALAMKSPMESRIFSASSCWLMRMRSCESSSTSISIVS